MSYSTCFSDLICICLLLVLCNNCGIGNSQMDTDVERITNFGVYYNIQDAKEAYNTEEAQRQNVGRLVEEFERRCAEPARVTNHYKAYPFIIIEGVHRTTRSIVGHKIARRMGAQVVPNPPKYMAVLSEKFPAGVLFRKAFFAVGIYGAACEARDIVSNTPVLINGHWLFQASFAIAKIYGTNPPPPSSPIYNWPEDLFKPDLVFFINSPMPDLMPPQKANDFRPVLIETFRRWKNPKIIELNSTKNYEELTKLAIQHINQELGTNYNPEYEPEVQNQQYE